MFCGTKIEHLPHWFSIPYASWDVHEKCPGFTPDEHEHNFWVDDIVNGFRIYKCACSVVKFQALSRTELLRIPAFERPIDFRRTKMSADCEKHSFKLAPKAGTPWKKIFICRKCYETFTISSHFFNLMLLNPKITMEPFIKTLADMGIR